ncbi:MAG: signal peptidase I [Candidatus Hydrogenedentes bacterium]|nr:signal peptidase I [Candidatus Hydrogenedentota bacterium]
MTAKKKKSKNARSQGGASGQPSGEPSGGSGRALFRTIIEWTKSIGIAILLAMLIRWPVAEPFKIPSGSMEPALHGDARMLHGDRIFVNKHAYGVRFPFNGFRVPFSHNTIWYTDKWLWKGPSPERWDIVVFKSAEHAVEHDTLVKRVVGLSGEQVLIRGGRIFINGDAVDFPEDMAPVIYTQAPTSNGYGLRPDESHSVVPEGHVFLLGDNSDSSRDGRWFGWMPEHHLLGRVTSVWFPVSRWHDFTGFTRSWWWGGSFALLGAYLLLRMFFGRSAGVYAEGLMGLLRRGEHVFIRFSLGLPIPFTGRRVGRGRDLKRGEVVLYRTPRGAKDMPVMLLGVVAGMPGERVSIEEGKIHIDGNPVSDPPVFAEAVFPADGRPGKYGVSKKKEFSQVPEDHFYILTDGNGDVPDSRVLGWVPRGMVVGPADWVWWPVTRLRRVGKA